MKPRACGQQAKIQESYGFPSTSTKSRRSDLWAKWLLFCGGIQSSPTTEEAALQIRKCVGREDGPCAYPPSAHCVPLTGFHSALRTSSRGSRARTCFLQSPPPLVLRPPPHMWAHCFQAEGSSFPYSSAIHTPRSSRVQRWVLSLGEQGEQCYTSCMALKAWRCSLWGRLPQPYREIHLASQPSPLTALLRASRIPTPRGPSPSFFPWPVSPSTAKNRGLLFLFNRSSEVQFVDHSAEWILSPLQAWVPWVCRRQTWDSQKRQHKFI